MKRGYRKIFPLCIVIIMLFTTFPVHACECFHATFAAEVAQSNQIFTGTVIHKTSGYKNYFVFRIIKAFKGNIADTVTIETGSGGPDCGMNFEEQKIYLVYANQNTTSRCRRNALAGYNADIVKLEYLFNDVFAAGAGKTVDPVLTANEAEYFNADLHSKLNGFDFYQKKVAIVSGKHFIDKINYFKNRVGVDDVNHLIKFTSKEKQKTGGYDAIIIYATKRTITPRFKKKLTKQLVKQSREVKNF